MRINVDDAGLHQDVNAAIFSLLKSNKIDSISIMANGQAIRELANLSFDQIWINLHFCIVDSEKAISANSTIVDSNGRFLSRNQIFWKILIHPKRSLAQIGIEATAQLKKLQELGFKVNGIDSHQHIHFYPPIFFYILKFAKKNNLSIRILKFPFAFRRIDSLLLMPIVHFDLFWAKLMKSKFHYAVGFEKSGHLGKRKLIQYHSNPNASELFAHPAISTDDLSLKYKHWKYNWNQEYQTLMNNERRDR